MNPKHSQDLIYFYIQCTEQHSTLNRIKPKVGASSPQNGSVQENNLHTVTMLSLWLIQCSSEDIPEKNSDCLKHRIKSNHNGHYSVVQLSTLSLILCCLPSVVTFVCAYIHLVPCFQCVSARFTYA